MRRHALLFVVSAVALVACPSTSHVDSSSGTTGTHGNAGGATSGTGGAMPGTGGASSGVGGAPDGGMVNCTGAPTTGAITVPAGWFLLSRWTTGSYESAIDQIPPEVRQRARLDAFRIDVREVTHGDYAVFVKATGATPLPDLSGDIADTTAGAPDNPEPFPQTCGWQGGAPKPEFLDHPAVCVTRPEAAAYCAWKGGRLPTVGEWMKAGVGPEPDVRRFPWGDAPPKADGMFMGTEYVGYAVVYSVMTPSGFGLGTRPVATKDLLGRSPHCVLGLAGNAAELLATCAEDLGAAYPAGGDLASIVESPKVSCAKAVLVGGPHWRYMTVEPQMAGSQSIYAMKGAGYVSYAGTLPESHWTDMTWDESWDGNQGSAQNDPAGNDRRDWRIGFRCAYDGP